MQQELCPSKIVIDALPQLKKSFSGKAASDVLCAMCGLEIKAGEPAQLAKYSQKFTDYNRLASPESNHICEWCASTTHAEAMRLLKQCVVTSNGEAYSLTKDAHRQWFFLTPPEPPFVCIMAEKLTAIAHLVWHTPVTLSRDLLRIQRGHNTLTIDRPYLLELVDMCREASHLARDAGVKITAPHPFCSLDRNLESMDHGTLRPDVVEALEDSAKGRLLLHEILQAGEGELFALATLAKTNPSEPLKETQIR